MHQQQPQPYLSLSAISDGTVACLTCHGKRFSSMNSAKRHYKEVHLQPDQQVPCAFCSKVFKLQRKLNEHMKSAHGVTNTSGFRRFRIQDRFIPDDTF